MIPPTAPPTPAPAMAATIGPAAIKGPRPGYGQGADSDQPSQSSTKHCAGSSTCRGALRSLRALLTAKSFDPTFSGNKKEITIHQDVLVDSVVIPPIVGRGLVGPARHAGISGRALPLTDPTGLFDQRPQGACEMLYVGGVRGLTVRKLRDLQEWRPSQSLRKPKCR